MDERRARGQLRTKGRPRPLPPPYWFWCPCWLWLMFLWIILLVVLISVAIVYLGSISSTCITNPCLHGGVCIPSSGGYTPAECALDPERCESAYQCFGCENGWEGLNCHINVDECASNPCLNNGICQDGIDAYTCSCPAGWAGKQCEINVDECASNPCLNSGSCHDGIDAYKCSCPGWAGKQCEINIDECAANPCFNMGTCIDGIDGYTCSCPAGFEGNQCQTDINECDSNPCLNGGTCLDLVDGYKCCPCPEGWNGTHCEIDVNECEGDPCGLYGICVDQINGYMCDGCKPGYTKGDGETCDYRMDCGTYLAEGITTNKIYLIAPEGYAPFEAFCELAGEDPGWTRIQFRDSGEQSFDRNWHEYKVGFGNLDDNHWLGNEKVYQLTKQAVYNLELEVEILSSSEPEKCAVFDTFSLADEDNKYQLHIVGFSTLDDPPKTKATFMDENKGRAFSTMDDDNDGSSDNCADEYKGGWWYDDCTTTGLNTLYGTSGCGNGGSTFKCISWEHGYADTSTMKIRRKQT